MLCMAIKFSAWYGKVDRVSSVTISLTREERLRPGKTGSATTTVVVVEASAGSLSTVELVLSGISEEGCGCRRGYSGGDTDIKFDGCGSLASPDDSRN